uniref:Uncharacterized protein n=1 Tax=Triticum urartu TaxID=4572 RepID=A0A8R7UEL4_TRIUA
MACWLGAAYRVAAAGVLRSERQRFSLPRAPTAAKRASFLEQQLEEAAGSARAVQGCVASPTTAKVIDNQMESEVAMGYTMTQICDRFIEFFMHEKPETKDWRKILVFREEWQRYRPHFYKRCQVCIDVETDTSVKQKLIVLARKVKKIDDEIETHMELFTELRENPTDINAIVARRRKDFTGDFFRNLNFLVNAYNGLDERDAIARLGAKCLSAIHAYDCTLQQLDIDSAQSKFDDILNSSSLDDACDKIKGLAKAKELDSSLVLLINRAWAAAKDSKTMKNKVGLSEKLTFLCKLSMFNNDFMLHIYTCQPKLCEHNMNHFNPSGIMLIFPLFATLHH